MASSQPTWKKSFATRSCFAGRIIEPTHDERRWLLLGQDDRGRTLALIFTRRRDRLRPVSCRPMRRKEKKLYEKAVEDIENGP